MRPRFTKMTTQNDYQMTTTNTLNINKLRKKKWKSSQVDTNFVGSPKNDLILQNVIYR